MVIAPKARAGAQRVNVVIDDINGHKESQWNAGEESRYIPKPVEVRAFDPKVIIKNDVFPREHEIYNCTTCNRAEPEHPVHKMNQQTFRVKCKFNTFWNEGPRFDDIGCPNWDRKIPIPKHGFHPLTESGPYDSGDKR